MSKVICAKSEVALQEFEDDTFDLLCVDPPYGMNFMGKEWDKALPSKQIWKECLRVLKPGAFAFVMCIPRADCLWRMIRDLELAGFIVKFTPMYWTYASGFPKAQNIGKTLEKRYRNPDKIIEVNGCGGMKDSKGYHTTKRHFKYDSFQSKEAKEFDGSYGGFQPKPAVEVIIVAMKPLGEKSYVEQALKNGKGISWLDDCRIPYISETDKSSAKPFGKSTSKRELYQVADKGERVEFESGPLIGRFPANLLVSDDVLNDEKEYRGSTCVKVKGGLFFCEKDYVREQQIYNSPETIGSFSRYFDIDIWFQELLKKRLGKKYKRASKVFPFLISTKASKSEKWFYCRVCKDTQEALKEKEHHKHVFWCRDCKKDISASDVKRHRKKKHKLIPNLIYHPTVKPLRLMCYLVTLGSREGDKVLDPFAGTCKTAMACEFLKRKYVMIDSDPIALKLGKAGIKATKDATMKKKLLKRIEE